VRHCETLSAEEKWCIFFKYRHEQQVKPLIDELCNKEEGIMRADKQVNKINRSFLKYLREMDEIKNEWDRQERLDIARREVLLLGHAKGHAEGWNEAWEKSSRERDRVIARNALAEGSTPEFIQKITGLDIASKQKLAEEQS